MGRQFAAMLGCLAFGVVLARQGLRAGDGWLAQCGGCLGGATLALALAAALGFLIGTLAERLVDRLARQSVLGRLAPATTEHASTMKEPAAKE